MLGHVADILGEPSTQKLETEEYQAVIRKKTASKDVEMKPQLIIIQQENNLQIAGGSKVDAHFDDINPELLYDTLRMYLLTNIPKVKKRKKIPKQLSD
ncbi:MAG TPA: hypothetical protein VMV49_11145 [Candidatus Deferrimicrobium sp.]|nr:hypothetical protein [Candidatus Deferrimicrobium sp.]